MGIIYLLGFPVSDQTRQEAIGKWLNGWPRDKIARELGIGAGTVTNIIAKWTDDVGIPTAAAVRELSVEIHRAGMSVCGCARGLRILRVLSSRLGSDEISQLESFVDKMYNKCKYLNISPDHLVEIASEIWDLSKSMQISQIPSYLNERKKEKENLEAEIKKLNAERNLAEFDYDRTLHLSNITAETLKEYKTTRDYLSKYGLGFVDLHKLMLALQNAERQRFDVNNIVGKISGNQSLADEEQDLRWRIIQEKQELEVTQRTSKVIEMHMDENAMKIKYCTDLESMGFGLDELAALKNCLVEIAESKNRSSLTNTPDDTVKLFFKRVEELRNLEEKIELLKKEKNTIKEIHKSLLDGFKDFIGQAKKDVKELSDVAIESIKIAYEKKENE